MGLWVLILLLKVSVAEESARVVVELEYSDKKRQMLNVIVAEEPKAELCQGK